MFAILFKLNRSIEKLDEAQKRLLLKSRQIAPTFMTSIIWLIILYLVIQAVIFLFRFSSRRQQRRRETNEYTRNLLKEFDRQLAAAEAELMQVEDLFYASIFDRASEPRVLQSGVRRARFIMVEIKNTMTRDMEELFQYERQSHEILGIIDRFSRKADQMQSKAEMAVPNDPAITNELARNADELYKEYENFKTSIQNMRARYRRTMKELVF